MIMSCVHKNTRAYARSNMHTFQIYISCVYIDSPLNRSVGAQHQCLFTHTHTHTNKHTHPGSHPHMHTYIYAYTCNHVHMCTRARAHVYVRTYTYIRTHIYMRVCIRTLMYTHACTNMHTHARIESLRVDGIYSQNISYSVDHVIRLLHRNIVVASKG